MAKLKERKKTMKVDPYDYTLHIVVSNDILSSYKKRYIYKISNPANTPSANTEAFIWYYNGCKEMYVFFKPKALPHVIAHECLHLTRFVMNRVGIVCNEVTDEAWAYLHDNLVLRCYNFVQNKK